SRENHVGQYGSAGSCLPRGHAEDHALHAEPGKNMAAHLTLGIALAIALGTPRVLAQGLSDPMRPPREIIGESAAAYEPAGGWSPVQVVIIWEDRRQAPINGRTVNLGGRYGDATLVRISDEEIVLRKGDATEV